MTARRSMWTRRCCGTAVMMLVAAGTAAAQAPEPAAAAGGYADAGATAKAAPTAPVYRGPTIDTLATVRQRGVLRIGVAVTEPFVMHDKDGELVGYSVDLGRKLADDLGVRVVFVPTSWDQIIPGLVADDYDVIASGLWITPSRALFVNFTEPTSIASVTVIASRRVAPGLTSKAQLDRADLTIAVAAGSVQEQLAATTFPKAKLLKLAIEDDPVAAIKDGRAQAALVTTPLPQLLVDQAPDVLVVPFTEPLQVTTTALAVRKGDPDLLNFLDSWLTFHRQDGWLAARQDYWMHPANWIAGM